MNLSKKSVAFYSCIFGNYDIVNKINIQLLKKFDFFLITNLDIKSRNWNVVKFKKNRLSNFFLSRYYKFFFYYSLKKYKYSVYFDGNIIIEKNFLFLLKKFISSKKNIGLFKHSARSNVYEEINLSLVQKKITYFEMKKLLNFYKKKKYLSNNDLTENCVILRKNNSKKLFLAMKLWWKLLKLYGKRDQILLPYVIWRTKISKLIFNVNLRDANYVNIFPHNEKNVLKQYKILLYSKFPSFFKKLNALRSFFK
jgi:hypothetical protein